MNTKTAIAFKYCAEGCGVDFYYGYSVEQSIGVIEVDSVLSPLPLILFDYVPDLELKTSAFERVFVIYLFRSVFAAEAFSEASELKKDPKYVTIAAGAHPSGDPEGTLKHFNYIIVGDCEVVLRDLLTRLLNGQNISGINGLWYLDGGRTINGGRASPVDLNQFPPFAPGHRLFGPIEITRGCPWACKFCCVSYIYGGKPRHRNIEEIVKWVEIAKLGGKRVINFLTPNAFSYGANSLSDPKRIQFDEIEKLLISLRNVTDVKIIFGNYLSNVRPDFVNEELIGLVKKYTQTPTIHMGGQSGSDRLLQISKVGYTTEDIRRAVKIVRNARLNASVDIIFGLPGESEKDRKETLLLIKDLITLGAKPRIHAFMPLPGTPWHNQFHGRLPLKYKAIFKKLASSNQVMVPYEYEEEPIPNEQNRRFQSFAQTEK